MRYQWLDKYLMKKPGVSRDFKVEWQWTRYLLGDKMFAAVCKDPAGNDTLITMKLNPVEGDFLRQQYADIIPGYYMNKVHWNSVVADGAVPDALLEHMLDTSYGLVLQGLSGKKRLELIGTDAIPQSDRC